MAIRLLNRLEIDDHLRRALDPRHYLSLGTAQVEHVMSVADRLHVHLVVYDAIAAAADAALCQVIAPAQLSRSELYVVQAVERNLGPRAIVVAYRRPVRYRSHPAGAPE